MLFNKSQTISYSPYQNNIFLDGIPLSDTILQKNIRYTYSQDDTVDECLWFTYNETDNDIIKTVDGNRLVTLLGSKEVENKNCIIVKYSPHVLCELDNLSLSDQYDDFQLTLFDNIPLIDFATGNTIVGRTSGAEATITCFSRNCDGLICLTYDRKDGEFIYGEELDIIGISFDNIKLEIERRFESIPYLTDEIKEEIVDEISSAYVNGSEQDYIAGECSSFKKFTSEPFETQVEFDSYSYTDKLQRGCIEETRDYITLQYTPNLLCQYDATVICDWDSTTLQKIETFPYTDFLTGQKIRGWHSQSVADVERASLSYKNGNRYIVLTLVNPTGDFLPTEPIEILSIPQNQIWDTWNEAYAEYSQIEGFFDYLWSFVRRPFYTANTIQNAICTGQLDSFLEDATENIEIAVDCCKLDKEFYNINVMEMSDYLRTCSDKCIYYPDDFLVYYIEFAPEVEIGTEIRIKIDTVPYVENNGTKGDYIINIPENSRDKKFYLNNCDYSKKSLEICLSNQSESSRAYTLDNIISENISCEYPAFEQFMKYHFSYSHSIGQGKYFMNNAYQLNSIDCIPKDLLDELAKETLGPLWCEDGCGGKLYESRNFQKEFVHFWKHNHREDGIKYLFNVLCWPEPTICAPCDRVFRSSGDSLKKKEYLYAVNSIYSLCIHDKQVLDPWNEWKLCNLSPREGYDPFQRYLGSDIRGLESRATATLENVKTFEDKNGDTVTILEISRRSGEFVEFEKLEILNSQEIEIDENDFTDDPQGLPPGFVENIKEAGIFLTLLGDILLDVEITNVEGEVCPFEMLYTEQGCQNGIIYADCVVDGMPRNVVSMNECSPNLEFPNGSDVTLEARDSIGNVRGTITGKAISGITYTEEIGTYDSRSSFTDDIVVLADNCLTDSNSYILSVEMNRKEYLEIYDETVSEAGSFMYSEYPRKDIITCDECNVSSTVERSFVG